jgi:hypothetical protein
VRLTPRLGYAPAAGADPANAEVGRRRNRHGNATRTPTT